MLDRCSIDIILGVWLMWDGIVSLFLPADKQWLWQLGRLSRIAIGAYLVFRGV